MNLTRDRVRSIGWVFGLSLCAAFTVALTFRVNAVKSEVRLAERQIVALRQEAMFLETEFETRANQQQLKNLNDVEFGYEAPSAVQYLENERELAALGKPRGPAAPSPIRVARAAPEESPFPQMVSPLTGKALAAEVKKDRDSPPAARKATVNDDIGARLSQLSAPAEDAPEDDGEDDGE